MDPIPGIDPPPQNQGFINNVIINNSVDVTLALEATYCMYAMDYMTKGQIEGIILGDTQRKVTKYFVQIGYMMDMCFGDEGGERG